MLNQFWEASTNQAVLNNVLFSKFVFIEFIPTSTIKIYKMHFKRQSNELSLIGSWKQTHLSQTMQSI